MPQDLIERIQELADRERRSFSSMALVILEDYFETYGDAAGTQVSMPATDAERDALMDRIR